MIVRVAKADDAEAIARVHVETWRGAYRGAFPDEVLESLEVEPRAERWRRTIERGPARVFVCERDGGVVGFVSVGPPDDAAEAPAGELYAIYVEPPAWDSGAGRELMIRALDELREAGYDEAILWVLEQNPRARRFYERGGWVHDGGRKLFDAGDAALPVVRYRRQLV